MTNLEIIGFVLLAIIAIVDCRAVEGVSKNDLEKNLSVEKTNLEPTSPESKQIFLGATGKETDTPNFVRLVVMRLIYGLASTMGVEERLEGALNGVFVPPNADDGILNFGGLGGGGGDDEDLFGGLDDLFE